MTNKLTLLFLCLLHLNLNAQQWVDKKYDYDSTLNITYGTAVNFNGSIDTLTMDIYTPICDDINHVSRKPLLIWIHGGAFLAGDKNEMTNLCKQFAKRGYVTATINYRLGFIPDDVAWNCNYQITHVFLQLIVQNGIDHIIELYKTAKGLCDI